MPKDAVLVALGGFVTEVDGQRLDFSAGDPIEANHPAVKANPHLFGPLIFRHPTKGQVEQATRAPGEKRNLLRRKPKAKAAPKAEPKPEPTPEPEPEPAGKALTTDSYRGR
jgi:hypothetical protein